MIELQLLLHDGTMIAHGDKVNFKKKKKGKEANVIHSVDG